MTIKYRTQINTKRAIQDTRYKNKMYKESDQQGTPPNSHSSSFKTEIFGMDGRYVHGGIKWIALIFAHFSIYITLTTRLLYRTLLDIWRITLSENTFKTCFMYEGYKSQDHTSMIGENPQNQI